MLNAAAEILMGVVQSTVLDFAFTFLNHLNVQLCKMMTVGEIWGDQHFTQRWSEEISLILTNLCKSGQDT